MSEPTKLQIWHGEHDAPHGEAMAWRSGMMTGDMKLMRYTMKEVIHFLRGLDNALANDRADRLQRELDNTAYVEEQTRIYQQRTEK